MSAHHRVKWLLTISEMRTVWLVPAEVMAEHREAAAAAEGRPVSRMGAAFIVGVWVLAAAAIIWLFWPNAAK